MSVITVQRGYESLEREGLIHSRRGKGYFVNDINELVKKEMSNRRLIENLEPLLKTALAEGMSASEILETVKKFLSEMGSSQTNNYDK